MPLKVPKTVLEAALGNGTVKKFRDFALVVLDGEGALCVPNDVWLPAASWANGRAPSGNRIRDRMQLLGRLDVLVTRRGTAIVSTSGAPLRLARLRDQMKRDGLDIGEWNFPAASVLDAALSPPPSPKHVGAEAEADPGPDEPLPTTTDA
ncbi:hypothetical protein [Nevskia sp.]|uniref:hypothetical protein n=1 Tax=Nevskia sp. TaxID=1929292 RepID=UPI0025F7FB7F|nr:hypothetical protein [Nevskia sp.]